DPRVRRPVVVDEDALPVPLAKKVFHHLARPGFGAGFAGTGGRFRPGTPAAIPAGMGGPRRPGCSRWMPPGLQPRGAGRVAPAVTGRVAPAVTGRVAAAGRCPYPWRAYLPRIARSWRRRSPPFL